MKNRESGRKAAGKILGQHFLKDSGQIKKIVNALALQGAETVIEIGPGHGELTKALIGELNASQNEWKLVAIEKDKGLAEKLDRELTVFGSKIAILQGDALKLIPELVSTGKIKNYKLTGNIPYYITGKLLRVIGELKHKPKITVLTVQKEVAERVAAQPPKMNLLAASVQFWAEPRITGYISRDNFQPRPKVDSAILQLKTITSIFRSDNRREKYYQLVKKIFKQPRKTILNNLTGGKEGGRTKGEIEAGLKKNGIDPGARPQNLTLEDLKLLSASPLFF